MEVPNRPLHVRDFARLPLLRLLDQRWWAARVKDLGCGSKPVKAAIFATISCGLFGSATGRGQAVVLLRMGHVVGLKLMSLHLSMS